MLNYWYLHFKHIDGLKHVEKSIEDSLAELMKL